MAKKDGNGKLHSEQNGQFVSKGETEEKKGYDSQDIVGNILRNASKAIEANEKKMTPVEKVVEVDMDAEVQKLLSAAETPKERQKIAFQYIMDNLRGKYTASDGRTVAIERVGADKITHHDMDVKLRVSPYLADFIKAGTLEGVAEAKKEDGRPHKLFTQFAYYRVAFQIGNDIFLGRLNVGIRKDGSATLYDLNPYQKQ